MATVLTIANQKGGVGKTTTAIMLAYILSQKFKVLCVDMDPQSDFTEALTQQASIQFDGATLLEAMLKRDAKPYIRSITETLHLIPSNDLLTDINPHLYRELDTLDRSLVLRKTLESVQAEYDFIIIDAAPHPDAKLANCLSAADFVVVMFKPAPFCEHALERFFESVEAAQELTNPQLKVAGILVSMVNPRRSDVKAYLQILHEQYKDLVFSTQIKNAAAQERFTIGGFLNNPETIKAAEPYHEFCRELMERIGVTING
jgi:chromosome partitioning protein